MTVEIIRYRCRCGYLYVPDPKHGAPEFEQLSNTWICPSCASTKDNFIEDIDRNIKLEPVPEHVELKVEIKDANTN